MAGAIIRRLISPPVETNVAAKCTSDLGAVKAVLEDAEEKRVTEAHILRWLDELRDLRSDMEDVLDEWNTALLKSKIPKQDGSLNKVRFSSSCFCPSSTHVVDRDITLKMKNLTEKLNAVDYTKHISRFNYSDQSTKVDVPERPLTSSLVDIGSVYGRDMERDKIVKMLLTDNNAVPDVVPIVGMGGMGKTTLAQLAYNDEMVKDHFDMRMWVCVSDPFDMLRVALAILQAISDERVDYFVDLDSLFCRLRECISGKKFLLVFDDVWNKDYLRWVPFKKLFSYGAVGSTILVTTRNESVARMMAATPVITLGALSEEDSWSLFSNIASWSMDWRDCKQLEEIGREIVSKCKGMPLALRTLGSILRSKRTTEEWLAVLNSEMWELEAVDGNFLAALRLSYYDLGFSVRRCFSYCAIFPKDYMIETDSLIKMWMSQGFLDSESRGQKELLGLKHFMDLASRSFFQEFEKDYRGNIIRCKMHDLVHDLAQSLTEHECFLIEVSDAMQDMKPLEKPRHGTFVVAAGAKFPISTCNGNTLRTAFFLCSTNTAISHDVFVHLKCLRTLNLSEFWFKELPKEIGKFIHLRYLNLSGNDELKTLPEALCELCNLQTLLVSKCMQLKKLPDQMEKLVSLKHLHVDGCSSLLTLPKGIVKLTSLRTLDMLVVPLSDNVEAFQLEDMKKLDNIEGYLRICRCGNLTNVEEAGNAQLFRRSKILDLNLDFSWSEGRRLGDEAVLGALRPHRNLESLEIWKYRGIAISPEWLMWLNNLRRLVLYSCQYFKSLPPLGKLASLESLKISLMKGVKKVGLEFLGMETDGVEKSSFVSFPKLRELFFKDLGNLKVWEGSAGFSEEHDSSAVMPLLNTLEIDSCFHLQVLPDFLKTTTLQNLTVTECSILQEHCKKETGKEWEKIAHVPFIKFLDF